MKPSFKWWADAVEPSETEVGVTKLLRHLLALRKRWVRRNWDIALLQVEIREEQLEQERRSRVWS